MYALNRQPTSTELQNRLSTLQSAYSQGATQFLTAMQNLGTDIFTSAEYSEPNDSEYVRDLYRTYLFREPDQSGWTHWTSQVPLVNRSNVRLAFAVSPEFNLKVSAISPFSPPGGLTVLPDGQQGIAFDSTSNRILNAGWSYDAVGNQVRTQLSGSVWQVYQYDAASRLTRILADDKVTERTTYTYGSDSQRLISHQPSLSGGQGLRTYYVAEGGSVIAEYTETGSGTVPAWSKSSIYLGPRLLSTVTPNGSGGVAVDYHHPDRLGTRLVTNGQNTNSFAQATLPFGTSLETETTDSTNKRFTSYDRSSTTDIDYAVNRHYDPHQGRFTQIDPIGMKSTSLSSPQSLNLYAYCENDPINNRDPSGLGFFSFLKKVFQRNREGVNEQVVCDCFNRSASSNYHRIRHVRVEAGANCIHKLRLKWCRWLHTVACRYKSNNSRMG
jgi:RHS repeat-associated protein